MRLQGHHPAHMQKLGRARFALIGALGNLRYNGALHALMAGVLVATMMTVIPHLTAQAAGGYNASEVIGQYNDDGTQNFTSSNPNSNIGFDTPVATAFDSTSGTIFVADNNSNRVLAYSVNATTHVVNRQPYAVLGQDNFSTVTTGLTGSTMNHPLGLSIDVSGRRLFVSEYNNNRVLVFNIAAITTGMTASNVLGQANLTSGGAGNGQAGLNHPFQSAYDPDTKFLYVTDADNHRVMVWNTTTITNGMNATYVLGQPNFTTYTSGLTSQKMNTPHGAVLDTNTNRLYIAEQYNHRVTIFNITTTATNQTPINVLGQANFTTNTASVAQNRLNQPEQVALDTSRSRLYVADGAADRVMVYDISSVTDGKNASYVMGQADFTSSGDKLNTMGFTFVTGVAYDSVNDLVYTIDRSSHRLMVFPGSFSVNNPTAVGAVGHINEDTGGADFDDSVGGTSTNPWGLRQPYQTALDPNGHRLFVADWYNNRVVVHQLDATNRMIDRVADWVLGQANFTSNAAALTQTGLNGPNGVVFDPGTNKLYVAEIGNARVTVFDVTSITNGEAAINVLGASNYTTFNGTATQSTIRDVYFLAFDEVNKRLFVPDYTFNRVMVFDVTSITNGEPAVGILGQTTYTASGSGNSATALSGPSGAAYDSTRTKLYVTEDGNHRTVVYDVAPGFTNGKAASFVLGQTAFGTSSSSLSSTRMANPAGAAIDMAGQRLFVADAGNARVLMFDVAGTLTNGKAASRVFGQADFTTNTKEASRDGFYYPVQPTYDPMTHRLLVPDSAPGPDQRNNHRIVVYDVDTQITTTTISTLGKGASCAQQLTASNPNGTTTYALTSGSMPPGCSINSAGLISGTTTTAGTYTFSITVSAAVGGSAGHGTLTGIMPYTVKVNTASYNATSQVGQYDKDANSTFTTAHSGGQVSYDQTYANVYDSSTQTLFSADYGHNRVLAYHVDATSKLPDSQPYAVLGQPDFSMVSAGTTDSKMAGPGGLAYDAARHLLFVGEWDNRRVSVFDVTAVTTGEAAVNVLGQPNFTSTYMTYGQAGITSGYHLAYGTSNKYLYVSDTENNRVLVFDTTYITNGMNALYVIGQPDFWTTGSGVTAAKLNYPGGIALDPTRNRLFVSDYSHRVLAFDTSALATGMSAVNILGQSSMTGNTPTTTQNGLNVPQGLAIDGPRNRLYVSDYANARVMVFDIAIVTNNENALYVVGQPDFTTSTGTAAQTRLNHNYGVDYDSTLDRVFVGDTDNHRIMVFDGAFASSTPTAVASLGHLNNSGQTGYIEQGAANTTNWGMVQPRGSAFDTVNHRMFVSDGGNSRILVYNLDSNDRLVDRNADAVLGQPDFYTLGANLTQAGQGRVFSLAYEPTEQRLYAMDDYYKRVVVYDVNSIINGENAAYVIGQPNFTTGTGGNTQAKFNDGIGIAVDDANNRLFVAETINNRVLVFNTGALANGMNASNVLGQSSYTAIGAGTSTTAMSAPKGIAFDSTGNRLYVADTGNQRILIFDTASITNNEPAVNVLGNTVFNTVTGGLSSTLLDSPHGMSVDTSGRRLFVADYGNNRVVQFDISTITNGKAASQVYGQSDLNTRDELPVSAMAVPYPIAAVYNPSTHQVAVSADSYDRVMNFDVDTQITTASLPSASLGVAYSQQLATSNPNGTTTYSISAGALPTGLSLSSAGLITGSTSAAVGTYNFTVQASTSPEGHGTLTGTKAMSIVVANPPYNATAELGQVNDDKSDSFTRKFDQGQVGFANTYGSVYDPTSNTMFLADGDHCRILAYTVDPGTKLPSLQPYAVLGQQDFHTFNCGQGASDLFSVTGLAIDVSGRKLFVAEYMNNRVSVWDITTITTGMSASYVLGQPSFGVNGYKSGQAGISTLYDLAFDPTNKYLYVTDESQNRVMVWNTSAGITSGMNASFVLGQPNFTTYTAGTTSQKFSAPSGLAIDTVNKRLFVGESNNNRVTVFNINTVTSNMAAINVFGQATTGTSTAGNNTTGITNPEGMSVDVARTRLYVSDSTNNRVMVFDYASITNNEPAIYVMGQPNFTTYTAGTSTTKFNAAASVNYDSTLDKVLVSDQLNRRHMVYAGNFATNGPTSLTMVGHIDANGDPDYTQSGIGPDVTSLGLSAPGSSALDVSGHRLFVSDINNNRVVVHQLDASNRLIDRKADWVLGQSSFSGNAPAVTQSGMTAPDGVAYDSTNNRLFVYDSGAARVLVFNVSTITNGMNAVNVLGQTTWNGSTGGLSSSKFYYGYGLGMDVTGQRLFVPDVASNRVLVFNVSSITNGQAAVFVLGQTTMTGNSPGVTASTLSGPSHPLYDQSNNRLYVADEGNSRVLVYNAATIANGQAAANVLGQSLMTTNSTGISASKMGTNISGMAIDMSNQRLFVTEYSQGRMLQFNVSTITNGQAAVRVFGQNDFGTEGTNITRWGMEAPVGPVYDPTSKNIWVVDEFANRVMMFDVDTQITTASLPDASNGAAYSQQLAATNPNGTTTYSVTAGSLPPGLSLSSSGAITGTPSGASGVYNITFQASTSPAGHGTLTGTRVLSITMTNMAPAAPTNLVQTKTNSIPIPGSDLYNFDSDAQGWITDAPSTVSRSTTTKRTGAGSIRLTAVGSSGAGLADDDPTRDLSGGGNTLSAWVYQPSTNNGTGWYAALQTLSGPGYDFTSGPYSELVPDTWTLLTFTPPPGVLNEVNQIIIHTGANGQSGTNYLFVDDVQQGNAVYTNETSVRFAGSVSDIDPTDTDQLCIEVQPIATPFTNTEQSCGTGVAYAGSPVTATNTQGSLANGTQYHWQARTRDAAGLYSSWVAYGGNAESGPTAPDFVIDTSAPNLGSAKDGPTPGVDVNFNTGALDTMSANWTGFNDATSGIARYEYSIGLTAGGTTVSSGWIAVDNATTAITKSGLNLNTSEKYFFNVRAVDVAGNSTAYVATDGQRVAPTLTFAVSSNSLVFDRLNASNSYAPPTKSVNLTTSTNAYNGYVVRQFNTTLMTSGTNTIPAYSGSYAAPTTWAGTGFGYTSSDTTIQGSGNLFSGGTKYAGLTTTKPGDVVADHTTTVSGTPISNEVFTLTYKLVSTNTQVAGSYSTVLGLGATALY